MSKSGLSRDQKEDEPGISNAQRDIGSTSKNSRLTSKSAKPRPKLSALPRDRKEDEPRISNSQRLLTKPSFYIVLGIRLSL